MRYIVAMQCTIQWIVELLRVNESRVRIEFELNDAVMLLRFCYSWILNLIGQAQNVSVFCNITACFMISTKNVHMQQR